MVDMKPRYSPALDVEPAPVGIDGNLAALGSTAALGRAGLPAHAWMSLSRLRADELAAGHGEKRSRENKRAIHGEGPIVENRWSAADCKDKVSLYSSPTWCPRSLDSHHSAEVAMSSPDDRQWT